MSEENQRNKKFAKNTQRKQKKKLKDVESSMNRSRNICRSFGIYVQEIDDLHCL